MLTCDGTCWRCSMPLDATHCEGCRTLPIVNGFFAKPGPVTINDIHEFDRDGICTVCKERKCYACQWNLLTHQHTCTEKGETEC